MKVYYCIEKRTFGQIWRLAINAEAEAFPYGKSVFSTKTVLKFTRNETL